MSNDNTQLQIPIRSHGWQGESTGVYLSSSSSVGPRFHRWFVMLLVGFAAATSRQVIAQEKLPERDAHICRADMAGLETDSLSPAPMPSDFEDRVVDLYLRKLDPRKMYFQQADVDRLRRNAKGLQRQLRRGDVSFMDEVLRVYQQRVREYDEVARQFADAKLDFTIDETINLEFRSLPYSVSVVESHDRWRRWTKYELLACRLPGETVEQKRQRMKKRYTRFFNQVITADRDDVLEEFFCAVTAVYDARGTYMSPKTVDSFNTW